MWLKVISYPSLITHGTIGNFKVAYARYFDANIDAMFAILDQGFFGAAFGSLLFLDWVFSLGLPVLGTCAFSWV